MQVILNDKGIDIQAQTLLQTVLDEHNYSTQKGIAVAVNDRIVPRTNWNNLSLQENDNILVITATKGG